MWVRTIPRRGGEGDRFHHYRFLKGILLPPSGGMGLSGAVARGDKGGVQGQGWYKFPSSRGGGRKGALAQVRELSTFFVAFLVQ